MAARSGSEFLERLSAARVHVEVQGETLTGGVADHPAFRNVVRSYAELYDMQHDPAYRDILTYPSPMTGEPVATAFLVPRTPGSPGPTPGSVRTSAATTRSSARRTCSAPTP